MNKGLFEHMKESLGMGKKEEREEKHTFSLHEIEKITIDACAIDIFIDAHESSETHLTFKTFEDGPEMEIEEADDALTIRVTQVPKTFHWNMQKAILTMKVPPSVAKAWEIRSTSRKVRLRDIDTTVLDIRISSGAIDCKTIQADTIHVKASSGDIKMNQIAAKSLNASVSSGSVDLLNVHCDHLSSSSTSGNNDVQSVVCKIGVLECSSGRVSCNQSQIGQATFRCNSGMTQLRDVSFGELTSTITSGDFHAHDISMDHAYIEGSSGNIFASLHPTMDNFTIDGVTSSGNVHVDAPISFDNQRGNHVKGMVGTGEKQLLFKATSGNIQVRK